MMSGQLIDKLKAKKPDMALVVLMMSVDTLTFTILPKKSGKKLDMKARIDLTNENTGHMVVIVSFSVIDQCLKWEKELQLMHLTSDAKHTKIVKNVSEQNMATAALENWSNTDGDTDQNPKTLNVNNNKILAKMIFSNVISNWLKIHSP